MKSWWIDIRVDDLFDLICDAKNNKFCLLQG